MDREIKFRAWDKTRSRMMWGNSNLVIALSGHMWWDFGGDLRVVIQDDYILMQYTGLLDKIGVEIYEGDIVRYTHEHLDAPVDFSVVFGNGAFIQHRFDNRADDDIWYDWYDIEVIGNIFENPELSEVTNG